MICSAPVRVDGGEHIVYFFGDYMDFSDALKALKDGKKITNTGWNGPGQYLYYVPANSYPTITDIAKEEFGEMAAYGAYIAIKTTQGIVNPWVPSTGDLFSEAWEIVE